MLLLSTFMFLFACGDKEEDSGSAADTAEAANIQIRLTKIS